ncbi:MAG TPA: hypothetical protein VF169_07595 [Albitalea sp.]|uniref:hypothetical protein n=1 Tax=Piscinibacter sp. TaxID=1903157 RepID=UPI002ED458B4
MSTPLPPPRKLPTLTEVVRGDAPAAPAGEQDLVQRVLEDVQRQVDGVLEQRVREALAPALGRLTDALLREIRGELASSLRDIVSRAVAQELSRHRDR